MDYSVTISTAVFAWFIKKCIRIEEIYFTHSGICIKKEQVQLWIHDLHLFFRASGNDVIGDAAKRL